MRPNDDRLAGSALDAPPQVLRVGILGNCGAVPAIEALRDLAAKGVELAGATSQGAGDGNAEIKRACPSIKIYRSLDAMAPAVDAVVVAGPPMARPRAVVKALERGLHVLCLLPAGTAHEARTMAAAAAKAGRTFTVGYPLARQIAHEMGPLIGPLGPARHVDANWLAYDAVPPDADSGRSRGVAAHFVAELLAGLLPLMGGRPARVWASGGTGAADWRAGRPAESSVLARFEWDDPGERALEVHAGWDTFVAGGQQVGFVWHTKTGRCPVSLPQESKPGYEGMRTGRVGEWGLPHSRRTALWSLLDDFVAAVRKGDPLVCPSDVAVDVAVAIDAVYESLRLMGTWVDLDAAGAPPQSVPAKSPTA